MERTFKAFSLSVTLVVISIVAYSKPIPLKDYNDNMSDKVYFNPIDDDDVCIPLRK